MFNPRAYANTRPDGIPVLELVENPAAPIAPVEGAPPVPAQPPVRPPQRQFVPLKRTVLGGEVVGPLASLRLTQVFGFLPEQAGSVAQIVEALYRFPLPGDAAVTGVRVRFGAVEIAAQLQERSHAEAEYETARREGRQATLLTRESPDVFTLRVAGIAAGQEVTVETAYVQLARPEGAGWTLRVPLTTAPRYVRSDEFDSRHAQGQPLRLLRDPGHRFALDLRMHGAGLVQSATHHLTVAPAGGSAPDDGCRRVALQEGEVVPDRDLVLSWRPPQEQAALTARVWVHDEPASEHAYFLALLASPLAPAPEQTVPRELIVLVDHSGSMEGAKWSAADWAVKQFVADLDEREQFALGVFHNTTAWLADTPRPATVDVVRRAYRFLDERRDSGGTELGVALEQALGLRRVEGAFARHVVVITDAEVSDAGRILRLAEDERRRPLRRPISVLCIDAAPNATLAIELADRSGGVARFLTSAPEEEDISTALDEVLAEWARPVLAGARLEANRDRLEAAGSHALPVGSSAVELAGLPAGRSVWVAGRVPRGDVDDLRFRLAVAGSGAAAPESFDLATSAVHMPAIKALFGARRIQALEYLAHAGYDADELARRLADLGYDAAAILSGSGTGAPRVYAENTRRDQAQALRALLVREALAFGLASSETSFVATRTEAGQRVQQTVEVANALPAGWSERFLTAGAAAGAPQAMMFRRMLAGADLSTAAPPPAASAMRSPMARPAVLREEATFFLDAMSAAAPAAADPGRQKAYAGGRGAGAVVVFSGAPRFQAGEAILFDSGRDGSRGLPDEAILTALRVRFPAGAPDRGAVDPDLRILLFVDDLTAPRAQVRLADLLRQQGERPLNVQRRAGQPIRIVLLDPRGAWASGAPPLEVTLGW